MHTRSLLVSLCRAAVLSALVAASAVHLKAAAKVGVLLGDAVSPFGAAIAKGFAEAGATAGVNVVVKAPPTPENVAQMQRLIAGWVADPEIKAVVIACGIGAAELEKSARPFAGRGVPVVALLGTMPGGLAKATVLVDESSVTAAATEQCLRLLKAGGELALLRSNLREGQMNDRERLVIRGVREQLPDLPIHADVFMNAAGTTPLEQAKVLLRNAPKTTLVYSPYTTATTAMVAALRETGRAGRVHHVGIGAGIPAECAQAIERGELDVLIAMSPQDVASRTVGAVSDLLAGKSVPAVVYSKVDVVTRANLPGAK